MKTRLGGMTWIAFLTAACAGTPGARPHEMSAAHHAAVGSAHEREADRHAAMFTPGARSDRDRCLGTSARAEEGGACWTSIVNPTAEHQAEAERHRRMAADHRTASRVLVDAEARACAGLSESDRDTSPFARREDILSVSTLTQPVTSGRVTSQRTVGSLVTFRAVPAMTAEWLQRLVDCHLARAGAMNHDLAGMPDCPLMPPGVSARVTSTGSGFEVAIRGEDEAAVGEVRRRAERLGPTATR